MASSDHYRRLAVLEAQARTSVNGAIERGQVRLRQLLSKGEMEALAAYWERQETNPNTSPVGAEIAAVERFQALCRTDPELQAIDRQFAPLQWAVRWGKAWQTRY